jgi:type IV pilus assembly protein PilV
VIFKIIKKKNESGLSILEALVAVVIFILGLAGIYMMSTLSNRAMISSIERDKLNMVSAMVIESMTIDTANIAKYDNTSCYESSSGSSLIETANRKKWAEKYKKIIGERDSSGNVAKEGSEDCKVEVKVIENENAHMITIIMTRKNGKKIQLSKRINNK